jgi:hypothetical protein
MRGTFIAGAVLLIGASQSAFAQTPIAASAEWEVHLQRAVDLWDQDQLYQGADSRDSLELWIQIEDALKTGQLPANMEAYLRVLRDNREAGQEFLLALQRRAEPVANVLSVHAYLMGDINWRYHDEKNLTIFLLFEALVRAHGGNPDVALRHATPTLAFGLRAVDEQPNLLSHLTVLPRLSWPLRGLSQILGFGGLSAEAVEDLRETLSSVEDPHFDRSRALAENAETYRSPETTAWLESKASREAFLTQRWSRRAPPDEALAILMARLEEFLELNWEHQSRLAEMGEQPSWETELWRRDLREEITDDPIIRPGGDLREYFARSICVETLFALVQQQVDLLTDSGMERFDPFTGEPLHMDGEHIWSLGPDTEDQGGLLVYDPTNGTLTPGDIVVPRPLESLN